LRERLPYGEQMTPRRWIPWGLLAIILVASAGAAVVGVTGSPSGYATEFHVYGPPGEQFSVAFPSTPRSEVERGGLQAGVVYAYWVSPDPLPLAGIMSTNTGSLPHPPVFLVVIEQPSLTATPIGWVTRGAIRELAHLSGMQVVTVNGLMGFGFIGSEESVSNHFQMVPGHRGPKVSDPKATEGLHVLYRGPTVINVAAITASPRVRRGPAT